MSSEGALVYLEKHSLIPKSHTHPNVLHSCSVSLLLTMNQMLRRTPAELTLDAIWRSGINLKKSRPKIGLPC